MQFLIEAFFFASVYYVIIVRPHLISFHVFMSNYWSSMKLTFDYYIAEDVITSPSQFLRYALTNTMYGVAIEKIILCHTYLFI